jgi:hypothetical protein
VHVSPASGQGRDGARVLQCLFLHLLMNLRINFAGGGYQGQLDYWMASVGAQLTRCPQHSDQYLPDRLPGDPSGLMPPLHFS